MLGKTFNTCSILIGITGSTVKNITSKTVDKNLESFDSWK
jgi:hypothetical protein